MLTRIYNVTFNDLSNSEKQTLIEYKQYILDYVAENPGGNEHAICMWVESETKPLADFAEDEHHLQFLRMLINEMFKISRRIEKGEVSEDLAPSDYSEGEIEYFRDYVDESLRLIESPHYSGNGSEAIQVLVYLKRWLDGDTISEIADEYKVSKSYVSNLLESALSIATWARAERSRN